MKRIIIAMLISINFKTFAEDLIPTTCGRFEIVGTIKLYEGGPVIAVYDKSVSEIILTITGKKKIEAMAYLNKTVKITGDVHKKISRYQGEVEINNLTLTIIPSIQIKTGSHFKLVKEAVCQ
jgi:hypothetical protein